MPQPLSPVGDATLTAWSVTFDWSDTSNTSNYHVQVYADPPTGEPVVDFGSPDSTAAYGNVKDGQYSWRVRACNYVDCGSWSEFASFVMDVALPGIPEPVSPANASAIHEDNPLFDWSDVPNTRLYNVELYHDSPDAPLIDKTDSVASHQWFPYLHLEEGNYFWHVQACNSKGCGPWSAKAHFAVTFPAPGAPKLKHPFKQAVLTTTPVRFRWRRPADGLTYRLEVWRDSTRGHLVTRIVTEYNTWTLSKPLTDGRYVWRVRACAPWACSEWSKRVFFIQQ